MYRQAVKITDTMAMERSGTTRKTVYEAIQSGRLMQERGLDRPYVKLKERPTEVARWNRRVGRRDDATSVAAG